MTLNEGDKAIVREIAYEVAKEMMTQFQAVIDLHQSKCPVRRAWVVVVALSVLAVPILAVILDKLWK